MKSLTLVLVSGIFVPATIALSVNSVSATSFTNPPPNNDWKYTVNYNTGTIIDTVDKFQATINGVNLSSNTTGLFSYVGAYWNTSFIINYINYDTTNPFVPEKISLQSAKLQHMKAHDGDGIGTEALFRPNIDIEASTKPNFESFDSRSVAPFSHGPHEDFNFKATLSCTSDNYGSECQSWFATIEGEHRAVPEPLTILGSVATIGFGAYAERKRKPSKSSKKDNTKTS